MNESNAVENNGGVCSEGTRKVNDEALVRLKDSFGLSETEVHAIKELITSVPEDHLSMAKYTVESNEHVCLRFLRARNFDVARGRQLLADCFKRKSEGNAKMWASKSPEECANCDIGALKMWYPHSQPGFDFQNRPILYEHSGRINLDGMRHLTSKDDLISYHWWTMETALDKLFTEAHAKSPNQGYPVISTCAIVDLAELTMSHISPRMLDHVRTLVSIDNVCYPELLGKMVIINAPWLAVSAWHLVRSWLDVRTQSKIEFLSAGAQTSARLKELIPLNVLPSEYGGSGSSWFCKKDHTEVCRFPHHMYSSKQDISRFIDVAPGEKLRVDTYVAEPMTLQIRVTARDVVAGDKDIKDEGKVQHTSLAASFLGFHRTKNAGKASEEETPAETVITETTVTKVAPQHHSFHHHHQQQHQQHHHESQSNDASSIQHSSGSSVNEGMGLVILSMMYLSCHCLKLITRIAPSLTIAQKENYWSFRMTRSQLVDLRSVGHLPVPNPLCTLSLL